MAASDPSPSDSTSSSAASRGEGTPPAESITAAAEAALQGAQDSVSALEKELSPQNLDLPDFSPNSSESSLLNSIDLLGDVELHVTIELGRTQMLVEDILKLSEGSIVELDKLAGDPVDVYVNNRLVARGEVLVLNDNFCIRISEVVSDIHEETADAAQENVGKKG